MYIEQNIILEVHSEGSSETMTKMKTETKNISNLLKSIIYTKINDKFVTIIQYIK